jgi:signal transduction histidine kinase
MRTMLPRLRAQALATRDIRQAVSIYEAALSGYEVGSGERGQDLAAKLRGAEAQVIESQEDERRRLARELHDEAGQLIATTAYQIDLCARHVPSNSPDLAASLAEVRVRLTECAERLHSLSSNLRPHMLDSLGLLPALQWLARQCSGRISVRVVASQALVGIEPQVETAIFRIAQEALANVVKHAGASTAAIHIRCSSDQLVAAIVDDGRGFPKRAAVRGPLQKRPSYGLVGIRERVDLLGGCFRVFSLPGRGTALYVSIPLTPGAPTSARQRPGIAACANGALTAL